ncbi:PREDICTED: uncharacterized protein LOC106816823 [Priapulus caudatus]|uniref:Uncharacterized protein LOC106816823 n=1 Tax=Priapulus caudatus TaxID=37621 RepID=A0ABM1EXM3_PRICU|nr:PREDICTED: uncharacterized protein LOC106816823 [Priapulus caudatus]
MPGAAGHARSQQGDAGHRPRRLARPPPPRRPLREGATGGGEDAVAPERLATLVAAGVKTLRGASVEDTRLASLLETARAAAAKTGPARPCRRREIVSSLVDLRAPRARGAAAGRKRAHRARCRTLLRDCYVGGVCRAAVRGGGAGAARVRVGAAGGLCSRSCSRRRGPSRRALVLRALVALLRQRTARADDGDAAEFLGRSARGGLPRRRRGARAGGGSSFARELVALLGVMARSSPPEGAAFWSDELAAAVVALFPSLPRKMRDQCFEAMQGPRVAAAWKDAVAEVRKSLKTGGKETGEKRIVKEKEQAGGESTEEEEAESATNEKKQKKTRNP